MTQHYLISSILEFQGTVKSSVTFKNGQYYVDYTRGVIKAYKDNLTLDQYKYLINKNVKLISDSELDELLKEHYASYINDPIEITSIDYFNALEVLPPGRWDGNVFYVIERITGNLVDWYIETGGKYYTMIDYDTAEISNLFTRVLTLNKKLEVVNVK